MKTPRLVTLGFLASCGLAMLAASACGDDDDDPLIGGSGTAGKAGSAGNAGKAGAGNGGSSGGGAGVSGASGSNSGSGGSAGSGTGGAGNAGASGAGNAGASGAGNGGAGAGNGGAGAGNGGAGGGQQIFCPGAETSCNPTSQYCLIFTPPKGAETGSCAALLAGCSACDCVITNAKAINDVCSNDDTVVCAAQDGGFTVNCNAPSTLSSQR